jgi:hypothetical protein
MPAIEGWTVTAAEVFNPDNLYDRINGAAPLFLANNFKEMTALDYKRGEDYITVQAYRHGTPEDAFGMYASERSPELNFLPSIGAEAQGDAENLFFFAGNIYVKMASHAEGDASQTMQSIAKGLASKIDPLPKYPMMLNVFPTEGRIPYTEAFINSSYIGHEFLKSVYTADYKTGEQSYQIFIIDGKTSAGASEILKNYFTFTKQPLDFKEGSLTIKDRYNGDIPTFWKKSCIVGIYSEGKNIPAADAIIKAIVEKL